MKRILISIILIQWSCIIYAYSNKQINNIDSIEIFSISRDIFPATKISRDEFAKYWMYLDIESKKYTCLRDSNNIIMLFNELSKLKFYESLKFNDNEIIKTAKRLHFKTTEKNIPPIFFDIDNNSLYAVVIIYRQNVEPEFIWIGQFYVDIKNQRYHISDELISLYFNF